MIGYHQKKQNYFFKSNVEKYFLQYTTASVPVKEFIYASHVFFFLDRYKLACVLYFLHFIERGHFKNIEKCFSFHLKSSFCSQYFQFFVIFCTSFPHFKRSGETVIIVTLRIGFYELANVILGITQKPICTKLSKMTKY